MKIAVYPGSFDPLTLGHLDLIERSSQMFDKLIIGVLQNNAKTPLFSTDERVNMITKVIQNLPNVSVQSFSGLTVDFAHEVGATVIVRGLRAVTDFEYELQMAQTNRHVCDDVDSIFLATNVAYSYISSSAVRELAAFGGNFESFVPPELVDDIYNKVTH